MNRTRNIFRAVFLILAVILLVYINKKTDDNAMSIVEFKYRTFKKIEADSLDTKQKLDLLINDTTKFVDDSTRVRKGIHYLMGLFGLLVAVELIFLILTKSNHSRLENE